MELICLLLFTVHVRGSFIIEVDWKEKDYLGAVSNDRPIIGEIIIYRHWISESCDQQHQTPVLPPNLLTRSSPDLRSVIFKVSQTPIWGFVQAVKEL